MEILEKNILDRALAGSMTYEQYRDLVNQLFAQGKSTGHTQSDSYLNYSDLNIHRMNKWDKHYKVSEDVAVLMREKEESELWLVISEGWCGDAAHSLPVMHKLAELSPNVEMKVVLRDDNPELIDRFLTNGARSIPKLIRLNMQGEVLSTWGPRPALGQKFVDDAKEANTPMADAKQALQLWYARDRGKTIEKELATMLVLAP